MGMRFPAVGKYYAQQRFHHIAGGALSVVPVVRYQIDDMKSIDSPNNGQRRGIRSVSLNDDISKQTKCHRQRQSWRFTFLLSFENDRRLSACFRPNLL
jgi:hypothetical protein